MEKAPVLPNLKSATNIPNTLKKMENSCFNRANLALVRASYFSLLLL
jgi:hypothetical protein